MHRHIDALFFVVLFFIVLGVLPGCTVNVVVAPNASLGIDSNNQRDERTSVHQYNDSPELMGFLLENQQ